MSLSDLASLGSFISGFAVLVSLVFLYFQLRQVTEQVRQAERNQRATIAQVRTNRTVDLGLRNCDPSMADAWNKAVGGDPDLTITQMRQFMAVARAGFLNAEDTLLQHRQGLLEDSAYRAFLASFGRAMAFPAYRAAWRLLGREPAGEEFAAFVDKLVAERPVQSPPSLAEWKSAFAEVMATATTAAQ